MSAQKLESSIYAYGFDRLGFSLPGDSVQGDGFSVRFLGYETEASIEDSDGLLIPSGIFEEMSPHWEYGVTRLSGRFDRDHLAVREKQVSRALQRGAWIAFLLGAVNNGDWNECPDTDLAKKILNAVATDVKCHGPNPHLDCKADEFRAFLEKFGIARTSFRVTKAQGRVLAEEAGSTVASECNSRFFFLPFFPANIDRSELIEAVRLVVSAVVDYKRRNDIHLPSWLSEIHFASERIVRLEIAALQEKAVRLDEEARKWERYKAVLCTSGRNLNIIVVEILHDFFGLNLKSEEKYVEDAVIYGDSGEVRFVVEIKGANGGIRREHVNQVDSHRERLALNPQTPGLLLVNDFMDIEGVETRRAKTGAMTL